MKKATIAATAGIAVTAFAAPTIASASTVVVEAGDTLWGIAQSKGTTVDAIKKANNLTTDKIVPGQKLQVNNEVAAAEKTEKSVSATWLNVRSGAGVDNSIITSIKGGTKVTVETTESNGWHKITYNDGKTGFVNGKYLTDKAVSTPVAPTQEVKKETTTQQAAPAAETKTEVKQTTQATTPAPKVAETKETPVVDQNATTHAVKSGDTIWALSVKYGVSVQDIMSWNNLSSSSIYVGQKLAIKQTANTATPKAEVKTEAPAAEKQAAPVVKENTNTNTATTEKKETATQQQTAPKAPTEAAKPAPAPSTNTNANKTNTNTNTNNTNTNTPSKNTNTNSNTNTNTNSNTNANQGSSINNSNSSASAIIAEAQKHLGKAYSWGGNGPTTFDCSGYTKYVFAKAGISLPRTSGAQYASTTRISESQAKPGDLVFFDYGSGISHVGIYVGNGQMINAQDNGVKYDNIHGSGWGKYLVGFGRV
ncbi:invasion associated endopeptidase [Listeria monocytogenes]|uniref:invasion associated endopeptidase n=1 Tax=Listeria monocytogenes TaxID=1639 RepID=UPI000F0EBE64|nr:invasion associated endopeptidase [Listeria monocytogenes]EAH0424783.1 invasion associated endopeptidase [Listeria monocytogenes]EGS9459278.1 invasion associated endopeptidase [Listeria monocytogenes]EHD1726593.1 invasion associated endopeptidase [Listeria monocytogenes]EIV4368368.1 invasion associated endopeptidase [Listeria monocytogenes]EJC6452437.1 invasion associated endopeptidase [Listeria monocytogenes]